MLPLLVGAQTRAACTRSRTNTRTHAHLNDPTPALHYDATRAFLLLVSSRSPASGKCNLFLPSLRSGKRSNALRPFQGLPLFGSKKERARRQTRNREHTPAGRPPPPKKKPPSSSPSAPLRMHRPCPPS